MKAALFITILIALVLVLGTRRIGARSWQLYAVIALVGAASVVGRWA